MSACLSTAASCYARSQDSLLHVLVSPGFEQQRDFYYPPPHPRWITSRTKDGIPCRLNTSDARIQLINMPLISLQAPLNSQTTEKLLSPEELLQKVSSTQPSLHVKPRHNTLQWQGKHASIPPSLMALYLFFIQHKLGQPCPYGACNNTCTQCSLGSNNVLQMNRRISQLYQQLNPSKDSRSNGIQQLDLENFNTYRCRLNRRLRQTFGAEVAELIGIRASGKRPGRQYDLPLSKDRIKIEE